MMKTRISILLIPVLIAVLGGTACGGRAPAPAPQPTSPSVIQPPAPPTQPPAGKPTTQPLPAQPQPAGTASPTPPARPDLIIAETTVTPTAANSNQVRIHIVARNQGGPISAAFTIRWHPHQKDKGLVGCSQDFNTLNQREWVVDCTYTYPAGERGEMHWLAVVDAANDVKNESNEDNNEKTGTVTIGGGGGQTPAAPVAYDLYVRRMDFTPAEMVVGGTITLHLIIATDTYPSGGPLFPASHFRWRKGAAFPWQEESCPANTQYASCAPNLTFSYTQPGDYVVEVEADSRKAVAESNENNNTKSWTITVKGQAGGQPPSAPTNCKATQIDTRTIRVEWQFTGQADGFRIYQGKTALEATVNASARSWTIADLPSGVQHHFDVRAYNAAGESRADACSVDVTRR